MSKTTPPPGNKVVDNYILLNVIGSGQFGDVYKAKRMDKEEYLAIKVISKDKLDHIPRLQEMTKDEVEILSKIKNPNVIRLYETLKTANNLYIVYELCNGGTLEEMLDKRKFLPEKEAFQIFRQILNGCKPLVKLNILHRDFKPSNILFHDNIVKIADFGFCKTLTTSQEVTETMVGSPIYMAPEVLRGYPYSMKADIYSLGVVLYELLYGVVPFEDVNIPGLLNKIKYSRMQFHSYNQVSASTEYLLKRMLEANDAKRIEWDELFDYFYLEQENDPMATSEKKPDPKQTTLTGSKKPDELKDLKFGEPTPAVVETKTNFMVPETRDLKTLLARFMKDCKMTRDKMVFLWRTFNQGCENLVNEDSHIINYLTLKKIGKYSSDATWTLQNKFSTFSKDEFSLLKGELDYTRVFTILCNEVSSFEETINTYKTYIQGQVNKVKTVEIENNSELEPTTFSEAFYKKKVIAYVESVRPKFGNGIVVDNNTGSKLALHLNLLLDSVILDAVYDNFFDIKVPFNDQVYLQNLFQMEEQELYEFAEKKLKQLNTM